MKRITVSLVVAWLSSAVAARADVGPPPRDDCNLLAPGSPCWVDGKRRGACVVRDPNGTVVCAAGATPTRAIASAKPSPSVAGQEPLPEHPPVPWCAARPASRDGGTRGLGTLALLALAMLARRRRHPPGR